MADCKRQRVAKAVFEWGQLLPKSPGLHGMLYDGTGATLFAQLSALQKGSRTWFAPLTIDLHVH
jgi:hypothetical protein